MHEDSPEHIPARLEPVLKLVRQGLRNGEIAAELHLTEHTVENYVSQLMALFDVATRTQLALAAYERQPEES